MRLAQQIGVTVKNHCLTLPYQWKSHPYPLLYFESPASRGRPVYSMLAPFFQELHFSHCSPFQDPNSIVMTIDMHLTLPPGFIEYTRRVSSCKSSTSGWGGPVYSMLSLHLNFQELRSWWIRPNLDGTKQFCVSFAYRMQNMLSWQAAIRCPQCTLSLHHKSHDRITG